MGNDLFGFPQCALTREVSDVIDWGGVAFFVRTINFHATHHRWQGTKDMQATRLPLNSPG